MYQYQQPMQFYAPVQQGSFLEVENISSIAMISIPPNDRRVYFDKHIDRFYTVETDAAGQKSITSYDFTKTIEKPPAEYVTVDMFNEWRSGIEQLISAQQPEQRSNRAGAGAHSRGEAARTYQPSNQASEPWNCSSK